MRTALLHRVDLPTTTSKPDVLQPLLSSSSPSLLRRTPLGLERRIGAFLAGFGVIWGASRKPVWSCFWDRFVAFTIPASFFFSACNALWMAFSFWLFYFLSFLARYEPFFVFFSSCFTSSANFLASWCVRACATSSIPQNVAPPPYFPSTHSHRAGVCRYLVSWVWFLRKSVCQQYFFVSSQQATSFHS